LQKYYVRVEKGGLMNNLTGEVWEKGEDGIDLNKFLFENEN
jgi:hypothetical protein